MESSTGKNPYEHLIPEMYREAIKFARRWGYQISDEERSLCGLEIVRALKDFKPMEGGQDIQTFLRYRFVYAIRELRKKRLPDLFADDAYLVYRKRHSVLLELLERIPEYEGRIAHAVLVEGMHVKTVARMYLLPLEIANRILKSVIRTLRAAYDDEPKRFFYEQCGG